MHAWLHIQAHWRPRVEGSRKRLHYKPLQDIIWNAHFLKSNSTWLVWSPNHAQKPPYLWAETCLFLTPSWSDHKGVHLTHSNNIICSILFLSNFLTYIRSSPSRRKILAPPLPDIHVYGRRFCIVKSGTPTVSACALANRYRPDFNQILSLKHVFK